MPKVELKTPIIQAPPKTSVRAIAQRLKLSPATVSLALNGQRSTSFVSVATRKKVWDAAREMGYPLDRLRSQRSALERAAVFMRTGPNLVYNETALGICRVLNQRRVQVIIHLSPSDQETLTILQELQRRQEVDAAILIGSRTELLPVELPCVFVGEVPAGSPVWQVRADNEGGGRSVGEYLWSLGHRAVAAVIPGNGNPAGERRLEGLRTYWEERGASLPDSRVLRLDFATAAEADLREAVSRFLAEDRQTSDPATALFCFNDWTAGKALKVLRSLGVRVPEELSVVGFDDSLYAELLDPPLTTVHNPFDALGSLAAELLLEQGEHPEAEPRVVVAGCRLVRRQSCAPPPAGVLL